MSEQEEREQIEKTYNKKLSEESKALLGKLDKIVLNAGEIIPKLYASLKADGLEPKECREIIESRVEISRSQLLTLLPIEAKSMKNTPKKFRTSEQEQQEQPQHEPTCIEVLKEQAAKLNEQFPMLSSKHIRKKLRELDEVKKFSDSTVRKEMPKIVPLEQIPEELKELAKPEKNTDLPIDVREQLAASEQLGQKILEMNKVIEWITDMPEWQRNEFKKGLEKGKVFRLALADHCKNRMLVLSKQMDSSHLSAALSYTEILPHLLNVFDSILFDEYKRREKEPKK
jgi:hypothetical protein